MKVALEITLKDTVTGETGVHREEYETDRDPEGAREGAEFYWNDGNASCDCHRLACLARAAGRQENPRDCGDTRVIVTAATFNGEPFPEIVE
jgi:hypothetical protein